MYKLFTTLLMVVAMLAMSQKAEAVINTVNDTLVINVTVQIGADLEIEWDDGAGGAANDYAARSWALGTATVVNLSGTYDTATHDSVALDILNSTTNIPIELSMTVTDSSGGGGWAHALAIGADAFTLSYDVGGGFTASSLGGPNSIATGIAPTAVVPFELQINTPSSVTTGSSGAITVTLTAAVM